MQTTQQFYEAFDEAGFLRPASWTPSAGAIALGATAGAKSAKVRFREMDEDYLDGMVVANMPSITFPASALPGLVEDEVVTLDLSAVGQGSAVAFTVRTPPKRMKDGSEIKAFLKRVA